MQCLAAIITCSTNVKAPASHVRSAGGAQVAELPTRKSSRFLRMIERDGRIQVVDHMCRANVMVKRVNDSCERTDNQHEAN